MSPGSEGGERRYARGVEPLGQLGPDPVDDRQVVGSDEVGRRDGRRGHLGIDCNVQLRLDRVDIGHKAGVDDGLHLGLDVGLDVGLDLSADRGDLLGVVDRRFHGRADGAVATRRGDGGQRCQPRREQADGLLLAPHQDVEAATQAADEVPRGGPEHGGIHARTC